MRKNTLQPAVRKAPVLAGSVGSQMAGLYDLEETLGKGHFAVVKAAKHVFTGERVAVKVIDKTKLDAVSQKGLLKEVLCMKLVQHPHVVRLYEVIDTTTKMYLVLELGQGDLYDLILKHQGGLQEDLARKYFTQILAAVSYCHKLHVAHRDLKPENVVFFPTDGGQVKLTDFGFSNRFCPGVKLDTSCGSLAYSAPEILLGDAYDAPAVDVWSLGVILYMLACGRAPFQEANDSETLTMIMDVKYSIPPHVSPLCHDLIRRMIVFYPENRANLEDIEKDPWITQDGYLLSQVQLPLISHNRLTNEEKNNIIEQMVGGDISTREQILEALQSNAFNHITSTFYLLAEKHLRERGNNDGDDKPGTSSALTASLESLHDRRKNSDTEDLASGEDDSLAPLDLEIKNSPSSSQSSKKTSRMHTVLSSSALSELDSLPILEEDSSVHCEEVEDTHGPLPQAVGNTVIRRAHYNNRRVMVPQRSASCSSSEDEDSEKKKRNLPPHRHKNKSAKGHSSSAGEELGRKFRDDESSDEQSGGCAGGGCSGTAPLSFTSSVGQNSSNGSSGGGGGNGGGGGGGRTDNNAPTSAQGDSIEKKQCNKNQHELYHHNHHHRPQHHHHHHHHNHIAGSRKQQQPYPEERKHFFESEEARKNGTGITSSLSFFDQEQLDLTPQLSNLSMRKLPSVSSGCGNVEMIDRHSCGDVAYAVKNVVSGTVSDPVSGTVNGRSVAKKSKKLFFSWLFLKKKKNNMNNTMPASSGIYKTRSCAELKLKNGLNRKQMDVNQNL